MYYQPNTTGIVLERQDKWLDLRSKGSGADLSSFDGDTHDKGRTMSNSVLSVLYVGVKVLQALSL